MAAPGDTPRKAALTASGRSYLSGSVGVLASQVMSMLAGVLSLWFLTRILDADSFAGYAVAMSLAVVLGYATGFGTERVMLLKIGAIAPEPGRLRGRRMATRIAVLVLLTTTLSTGLAILALGLWPGMTGGTDVRPWLIALAPMVPAIAIVLVLQVWFQSNHEHGVPQAMDGVRDAARCAGFALILALGLGAAAVAPFAVIAALLPIAVLVWRARGRSEPEPAEFTARDLLDGLQFFTIRLSQIGFHHLDVMLLAAFAPDPALVAQYVVATRFAAIVEAGQRIFSPAYTPRARRFNAAGDDQAAAREYDVARTLGLLASAAGVLVFVLIGRELLSYFGDFGAAYGAFLILCAAYLLQVGFGLHTAHLSMVGELTLSTLSRIGSLIALLIFLVILIPPLGQEGAALSLVLAHLVLGLSGIWILRAKTGMTALSPMNAALLALGVASLLYAGFAPEMAWVAAAGLVCLIVVTAARDLPLLKGVTREVLSVLQRP